VARTDDFRQLAYEVALQVAATNPLYIDRGAIPEADLERQRSTIVDQLRLTGTAEDQLEQTAGARLEEWVKEVTLLEQPYVRDPKNTIRQLILGVGSRTGENIRVGRFARFKVGE
jgi:elongation factor Ts